MLVANFLGTMRPDHDGVTRVIYHMRSKFDPKRVQNIYFSPLVLDDAPEDVHRVPSLPWPFTPGYRLAKVSSRGVAKAIGDAKPDIVHLHTPCPLGRAATVYARRHNIPMVVTYHTHFPSYLKYYHVGTFEPVLWRYLRWMYKTADKIIVPSRATMKELAGKGIQNLVHIPHGVQTEKFSPTHRSEAWREEIGAKDKVIVACVSRLVWEKNLKVVVEASHLIKHKDKVKFVFAGDGHATEKLKELMPDAHFTGFLHDDKLPMVYASSDIFIFPSVTETFGNVTIEAMASGLPALCADRGGACDMVDEGKNGFLAHGTDAATFARHIDFLVENPKLRTDMSVAAYETSRRYQWDNAVRAYEALYQQVIDAHATERARSVTKSGSLHSPWTSST